MKTIIEMAREAGFVEYELEDYTQSGYDIRYERFAALVRADERGSKKPWVGLTDDEKILFSTWLDYKSDHEVFTAIETKLKEKNT